MTTGDARTLCAFRRSRRAEYRLLTLPTIFFGPPEPVPGVVAAPADADAGSIRGAAGSAGTVEGAARVALTVEDAAGLVIDVGAPASHGAIISRELGVPCVIGTADGTARIRTGDWIRVDGSGGTVEILTQAGL